MFPPGRRVFPPSRGSRGVTTRHGEFGRRRPRAVVLHYRFRAMQIDDSKRVFDQQRRATRAKGNNMVGLLWRSAILGGALFALFVWGFGLPGTWSMFISIVFGVALITLVGGFALVALKWVAILALISELLGDDE